MDDAQKQSVRSTLVYVYNTYMELPLDDRRLVNADTVFALRDAVVNDGIVTDTSGFSIAVATNDAALRAVATLWKSAVTSTMVLSTVVWLRSWVTPWKIYSWLSLIRLLITVVTTLFMSRLATPTTG